MLMMREEYVKKNEQTDKLMNKVLELAKQVKTAGATARKKRQDTATSQSEEEK